MKIGKTQTQIKISLCLALLLALAVGPLPSASAQPAEPLAGPAESWRTGITVEGETAFDAILGRLLTENASFISARSADSYFVFPAAARKKTVTAASTYLLERSGTYSGNATLSLEIYNLAGTLKHTVTSATVDLQSVPTGEWTALALSGTAADLEIVRGEYLAFHFHLDGAAGGDLVVRPLFEVLVE